MSITQKKGNIGLTKAIADLTEKEISVSLPISESEKYDLIAEKNNICKTVQIRYCSIHNGVLPIKLKSVWSNGQGYQVRNREKADFDMLGVYCPDTKLLYYIPSDEFNCKNTLTLRIEPSDKKNDQRIRMAKDYLEFKIG